MSYPAENSIAITQAITTTTYITNPITFPGLTVTQLTPGEAITLVPLFIRLPLSSAEPLLMRRVGPECRAGILWIWILFVIILPITGTLHQPVCPN